MPKLECNLDHQPICLQKAFIIGFLFWKYKRVWNFSFVQPDLLETLVFDLKCHISTLHRGWTVTVTNQSWSSLAFIVFFLFLFFGQSISAFKGLNGDEVLFEAVRMFSALNETDLFFYADGLRATL